MEVDVHARRSSLSIRIAYLELQDLGEMYKFTFLLWFNSYRTWLIALEYHYYCALSMWHNKPTALKHLGYCVCSTWYATVVTNFRVQSKNVLSFHSLDKDKRQRQKKLF